MSKSFRGLVCLLSLAVSSFSLLPSHAALMLVEDFDKLPAGALGNQSGWTTTTSTDHMVISTPPGSASNHVLESTNTNTNSYKALPASIGKSEDTIGTLYFEFSITTTGTTGLSIGLTAANGSDYAAYTSQIALNSGISVWNAGAMRPITNVTLLTDTWYQLWVVVDNNHNTWSAYLLGGNQSTLTRLSYGSSTETFSFRTTSTDPIESLLIARGGGGGSTDRAYVDNIYFALGDQHGVMPSSIPEPSSLIWLGGLGLLASVYLKKRLPGRKG